MILGIGVDIVRISRIEGLITRFGEKFCMHVFGKNEIKNAPDNTRRYYEYLAARFAAKEAFVKAIGTGFINGIKMKEIEILNDELGKPFIVVPNNYPCSKNKICISLSNDGNYATAFIVIEN